MNSFQEDHPQGPDGKFVTKSNASPGDLALDPTEIEYVENHAKYRKAVLEAAAGVVRTTHRRVSGAAVTSQEAWEMMEGYCPPETSEQEFEDAMMTRGWCPDPKWARWVEAWIAGPRCQPLNWRPEYNPEMHQRIELAQTVVNNYMAEHAPPSLPARVNSVADLEGWSSSGRD